MWKVFNKKGLLVQKQHYMFTFHMVYFPPFGDFYILFKKTLDEPHLVPWLQVSAFIENMKQMKKVGLSRTQSNWSFCTKNVNIQEWTHVKLKFYR